MLNYLLPLARSLIIKAMSHVRVNLVRHSEIGEVVARRTVYVPFIKCIAEAPRVYAHVISPDTEF